MSRIGVFVCHCGENISRTVDVERVAAAAARLPGVAYATDYKYMCSDPGQGLLKKAVAEHGLDGVVVAACSPRMHEKTFRTAAKAAGLNPFLCEMANIREHCSWVHEDREEATEKASAIVEMMVARVKKDRKLVPITVPVTKRALVIGGGIAGIQAALDIADAGHQVVLVEREPSIGGHMAQLSETFPTLDCSQCIMTPKMVDAANHPNITLHTYSEIEAVDGYIGNFSITIRKKARSVIEEKCTGCGVCSAKCPQKKIPNTFDKNLGMRPAIYVPFPQAVPNTPVIDREHCTKFINGKCGVCQKVCGPGAIDYEQQDQLITEPVGAIVVATGFELYSITEKPKGSPIKGYGEFGHGTIPDVIDGLTFERLASASGPTGGKIVRPSDGKEPKRIAFVQCAGSRDENHLNYCSYICCMASLKHVTYLREKNPDARITIYYIDLRTPGRYDNFMQKVAADDKLSLVKGKVAKIVECECKSPIVTVEDAVTGIKSEERFDLVVLATGMQPSCAGTKLPVQVPVDEDGFIIGGDDTGVIAAGCAKLPLDVMKSAQTGTGAAMKAIQTVVGR